MLAAGILYLHCRAVVCGILRTGGYRPTVAAFAAFVGALSMLLHVEAAFVEKAAAVLSVYGWIIAIAPVMLASVLCALFHRAGEKEAKA
jgi:hypothetical protein